MKAALRELKVQNVSSSLVTFSTAHRCYERPSNTSTADCSVNCTHPENLCFKHSYKGEEDDPVTIQGCMSADQCSKNQSEHLKCCEGDFCNKGKTNNSHLFN